MIFSHTPIPPEGEETEKEPYSLILCADERGRKALFHFCVCVLDLVLVRFLDLVLEEYSEP